MLIPIGDNIERRTFPIVPTVLIFTNVLVFAFEFRILGDADQTHGNSQITEFFNTWGLVPAQLAEGEVVGLLTHMFLHAGFFHIVGNMFFLWAFSCSLEVGLGRGTLLGFYLLFGIVGGLAHSLMDMTSTVPMLGASGAVAGLIGAHVMLYGLSSKIKTLLFLGVPVRIDVPAWLFGVGWFAEQWYSAQTDPELNGGVAWYAHIGGFLAGVLTVVLMGHQTECDLQKDKHGNLRLDDAPRAAPSNGPEWTPVEEVAEFPLPETCPYCDHPLDEQNRITPCHARCGNDACQRMVELESDVGSPASSTSS